MKYYYFYLFQLSKNMKTIFKLQVVQTQAAAGPWAVLTFSLHPLPALESLVINIRGKLCPPSRAEFSSQLCCEPWHCEGGL